MGKGKKYTEEQMDKIFKLRKQGLGYHVIAQRLGVAESGVGNLCRRKKVIGNNNREREGGKNNENEQRNKNCAK